MLVAIRALAMLLQQAMQFSQCGAPYHKTLLARAPPYMNEVPHARPQQPPLAQRKGPGEAGASAVIT